MARVHKMPQFLHFFVFTCIVLGCFTGYVESANRDLNEENWRDILEGEWMVEFYAPWCPACTALAPAYLFSLFISYAPWCPACTALAPAWRELSARAEKKGLETRTGAVDVTQSPGLSGRFVVTALPTIFHVKDGEFRQYKGPRDVDSMLSFVEQRRWQQTEPIPSWKAPHSLQMTLVAEFFKLSQALRSVHNMLMETYGLPTWGSYLIFAVATIFFGALLGLLLVCVIDLLYPPRRAGKVLVTQAEADRRARGDHDPRDKSDDDQELLHEDIVDDAVNEANSDAEKNSQSDTSDDEKKAPAGDAGEAKAEVRKRRPRKAD